MSSKLRKVDREGGGIADWWVLVTRPLGMAPHEPLDDAGTMRDGHKYGGNTTQNRWHVGPARETLGASCSRCCAQIYIVENLSTNNLD